MTETPELALDLGWCVVRPITNEQHVYLRAVKRENRERATLACYAGIKLQRWHTLTERQREELWYAAGWMLRPNLDPRVGRVVDPAAVRSMMAPPSPTRKPRKPYTRRTAA